MEQRSERNEKSEQCRSFLVWLGVQKWNFDVKLVGGETKKYASRPSGEHVFIQNGKQIMHVDEKMKKTKSCTMRVLKTRRCLVQSARCQV